MSANETLCGHERAVLLEALRPTVHPDWRIRDDVEDARCIRLAAIAGPGVAKLRAACLDTNDPAKIGELLVASLGLFGFTVNTLPSMGLPKVAFVYDRGRWVGTLPQARALLLRILMLPEGAMVDDVMRAVLQ